MSDKANLTTVVAPNGEEFKLIKGKLCLLSIYSKTPFKYKGKQWDNAAQAFYWEQAMYFDDKPFANLLSQFTKPDSVRILGESLYENTRDEHWLQLSYDTMKTILGCKFTQNQDARECLLNTGPHYLLYVRSMKCKETRWNQDSTSARRKITVNSEAFKEALQQRKKNQLGQILMDLRSDFGVGFCSQPTTDSVSNNSQPQ